MQCANVTRRRHKKQTATVDDIKVLLSQEAKRSYDKLFTQMKGSHEQKKELKEEGKGSGKQKYRSPEEYANFRF